MSTQTTYTLYTAGEYVVLSNKEAYCDVEKVTGIEECFKSMGVGTILKKEFRYSIDSDSYSEFQEITEKNLSAIGSFETVWFQFRYILLSGGPVIIEKVRPKFISATKDSYSGYKTPRIENENEVYAFPVSYKSNFLWEPYKLNRAVRLYKDLNLMVNDLFGHDTIYYRALPQGRSKDVFLMEHSLFNHDEGQCVKVVVPDNAFPDNKLNMGPFGVDFEMPFEIQVDKDYYQKIFGDGTGPQKRDVIYFPKTSRIYEVSSSYLFRDFMNEPLYFKVTLVKWHPKSNAENSETLETLESFTRSATKFFSEEQRAEEIKTTNPQQFEKSSTRLDPVRSFVSKNLDIREERVLNYHTVISEFNYNLSSLLNSSLLSVKLSSVSNLEKDTTYYVRFDPSSNQPDEQYKFSVKKLKYSGENHLGESVFEFSAGNSQIESNFSPSLIFGPGSLFFLFKEEYNGFIDSHIISCDTPHPASYFLDSNIKYKANSEFHDNQDRAYSAWFRIKEPIFNKVKVASFSLDVYTRELELTLEKKTLLFVGDSLEIFRSSNSEFFLTGKVVRIVSQTIIVVEIPQYFLDFIQSSYSTWVTYTDLQVQKNPSKVFLDSLWKEKGIKIELFGKRHFRVSLNNEVYYFSIPNSTPSLEKEKWYALFINISNMFKQLTLNVWKIQWDSVTNLPATTDLSLLLNRTVNITREDRSSEIQYSINPSAMDLTNVRLFNRVAETEKQALILNQNIVIDADHALIIDNAIPQSKLPYVGYTR